MTLPKNADTQVIKALLKRARGYFYKETTYDVEDDKLVKTKVVVKHQSADLTAIKIWLEGRQVEGFKRIDPLESIDDETLKALLKQLEKSVP